MYQRFSESLGHYLKKERESRKISREKLSRATRISPSFLTALEENDFDFFPQQEFIPAFLKAYARHLDLDYEEVMQRFHVQWERNRLRKAQQLPLFSDAHFPIEAIIKPKWNVRRLFSRKFALVMVICISLGLSLYIHILSSKTKGPQLSPSLPENGGQAPPEPSPRTATGEGEITSPSPSANGAGQDSPAAQQDMTEEGLPRKIRVIGNSQSKRYHLPGMKDYDKVEEDHRVEFESEEEALQAGYQKAKE